MTGKPPEIADLTLGSSLTLDGQRELSWDKPAMGPGPVSNA